MKSARTTTTELPSPPDTVFAALLGVVQHGKFTIGGLSNEERTVVFRGTKSAFSWEQDYVAQVTGEAGSSRLSVACGVVDGRPSALLDGRKNAKAGAKLAAEVEAVVAGTSSAPVTPTASFLTADDGTQGPWTTVTPGA